MEGGNKKAECTGFHEIIDTECVKKSADVPVLSL